MMNQHIIATLEKTRGLTNAICLVDDVVSDVSLIIFRNRNTCWSHTFQVHPVIKASLFAVKLLTEVHTLPYPEFDEAQRESTQACRQSVEYRKATRELVLELDGFLSLQDQVALISERAETRRAVEDMLKLIAEVADYIRNRSSLILFVSAFSVYNALLHGWPVRNFFLT